MVPSGILKSKILKVMQNFFIRAFFSNNQALSEILLHEIIAGQSDRHHQISAGQNTNNGWSMTVTRRLFPGLLSSIELLTVILS